MLNNLRALLPDEISDEAAYHLVNLFIELAAELESHYFAQMRQYIIDNTPPKRETCIEKNVADENDF